MVRWVIVVLLPNADGGRRPIGLIPVLPRIRSRARRAIAGKWEAQNPEAIYTVELEREPRWQRGDRR